MNITKDDDRDIVAMDTTERLKFLAGNLGLKEKIQIVDIGANPIGGVVPYKPLLEANLCQVAGFEPHPDAYEKLLKVKGDAETYYNCAVGDGKSHKLNIYAASGFTSVFKLDQNSADLIGLPAGWRRIVSEVELDTSRLDEIEEIERVDFLKIDIQGGELAVFQNSRNKLGKALAIQTEVRFLRLYENEPDFGEVNLELVSQGFEMHSLVSTSKWALDITEKNQFHRRARRQMIDGDMIYVRELRNLFKHTNIQLKKLAILADGIFESYELTVLCIDILASRHKKYKGLSNLYVNNVPEYYKI